VLSVGTLAKGMPRAFLEKILLDLRRAGLVEAVRGAKGGYRLAVPAREITVEQILLALGEEWQVPGEGSFMGLVERRMAEVVRRYVAGLTLADLYCDWQSWQAQQRGEGEFTI
ncbi:MAG: RrF2 family transcriptional regulator, partial [Pseudanabaenaceae cyanobacterium]